jgi:hypothetical protein
LLGPLSDASGLGEIYSRKFASIRGLKFGFVSVPSVSVVAAGVSFALFTLEPIGKRKVSVLFYLFLLLLLLPLSVANYYTIAFWTERLRQAIFDVLLVLLGLAAIQRLLAYKVLSISGRIIRGLAVFLLGVAAVIIPAIYSVIWFLSANAVAKSAQAHGAWPGWISVVAALLAAAFAIFTDRSQHQTSI